MMMINKNKSLKILKITLMMTMTMDQRMRIVEGQIERKTRKRRRNQGRRTKRERLRRESKLSLITRLMSLVWMKRKMMMMSLQKQSFEMLMPRRRQNSITGNRERTKDYWSYSRVKMRMK